MLAIPSNSLLHVRYSGSVQVVCAGLMTSLPAEGRSIKAWQVLLVSLVGIGSLLAQLDTL